jgi:alginate production protein
MKMRPLRPFAFPIVLLVTLGLAPAAGAQTFEFAAKLKAAGYSEESRDLESEDAATEASFLDLQPQLLSQFTPNFAHFMRLQGFVPSDTVVQYEQDEPVAVESYAAVREFWFEYGGITDYPGEVFRVGLQRLREPDGILYDRDIEAARWIFDTTLFQFQLGAAKQFQLYRTDEVELPESQRDRAYGFADIGTQWIPGQFLGVRGIYATDQKELPANNAQMEPQSTTTTTDPVTGLPVTTTTWDQPEARDMGWVGGFLDNKYFAWDRGPGVVYRFEVLGLTGSREYVTTDPVTGQVNGRASQDINALGADAYLRARLPDAFPLVFGSAYAYAEGGSERDESNTFRQTGLQSNRSRFTGTRTMINRFNEALQADLQNLRVLTGFVSMPLANWDFSVVGSRFEREDAGSPVSTDGITARPLANGSTDLGIGFDAVITRHFQRRAARGYANEDDNRSNLRLRASSFDPGTAYAPELKDQVRVMLEGTLWF